MTGNTTDIYAFMPAAKPSRSGVVLVAADTCLVLFRNRGLRVLAESTGCLHCLSVLGLLVFFRRPVAGLALQV